MAEQFAPQRFLRGVAEPRGRRAFLRDQAGMLVALDLSSGNVLWRTTTPTRPLFARDEKVLGVCAAGPNTLKFVLMDSADGHELYTSRPLVLPEWANITLEDTPEFAVRVDAGEGDVLLHWAAHGRYRGGAAPSARILEAARKDVWGAVRVNLHTGDVQELPAAIGQSPEPSPDAIYSPAQPDVLEQHDIGGRRFQLAVRNDTAGGTQVIVRAVDILTARNLWETVISHAPVQRPRPLRQ